MPASEQDLRTAASASRTVRLVVYAAVSIGLMMADHQSRYLDKVRAGLAAAFHPVYSAIDMPSEFGSWLSVRVADREELATEMERLQEEVLLTRAELHELRAVEAENQRLRELLDSSREARQEVTVAELLSVDLDPYSHRVVLNRGSRDQVFPGQPVMDGNGVLGQVDKVSLFSATAVLISDPSHALPVEVERTGLRSIAFGGGATEWLELPNIPLSADVQPGDRLLTSGMGGRFPSGLPVAVVERVNHGPGEAFTVARARPLGHLDRTRMVLLVWPQLEGPPVTAAEGAP